MRVFVIGATGVIGHAVVEALAARHEGITKAVAGPKRAEDDGPGTIGGARRGGAFSRPRG